MTDFLARRVPDESAKYPGLLAERTPSGIVRYRVRKHDDKTKRTAIYVPPGHPDFDRQYWDARAGVKPVNPNIARIRRAKEPMRPPPGKMSYMLAKARERAAKKGLPYALSEQWLRERYDAQNGRCALSGVVMLFDVVNGRMPHAPSIDRIDCKQGYVPENCRLLCVVVNLALLNWGDEIFTEMCREVAKANPQPSAGHLPARLET